MTKPSSLTSKGKQRAAAGPPIVQPSPLTPNANHGDTYLPITNPEHRRVSTRIRRSAGEGWKSQWPGASEDEVDAYLASSPKPPGSFAVIAAAVTPQGEPRTYRQAMALADSDDWHAAMQAEYDGLREQGTWELVDLPPGRKAIKSKWVYKLKLDKNGDVERYKARLVAKGFEQVHGIDYEDTFAPVARLESWRYLIALATNLDWEIHQIDFHQAYLNGSLDEEVYMEQPEGFVLAEGKVCRLRKALYGLKQAGRQWFLTLKACLEKLGFVCHDTGDVSIFVCRRGGALEILVVYVDDLTMMGNTLALINRTKAALKSHFKITDLGDLSHYLGIRITRDRGSRRIYLDQEVYINSILACFGHDDCNPATTPLPTGIIFEENPQNITLADPAFIKQYRSLLGSLMYAMLGTRPDIAFAVARLCQYQSNPSPQHMKAAKHILRYLRGTSHLRLCLGHDDTRGDKLVGYTDADFAGDPNDSLSTSGWVFYLGHGAVCWSSRKQGSVAKSTFDSEYFAAHEACEQLKWLDVLAEQIEHPLDHPVLLHCDNKSAVDASTSPKVKHRSKHTRVRAHSVVECVTNGLVQLVRIPGTENPADIFTKSLPAEVHERHTRALGLVPYQLAEGSIDVFSSRSRTIGRSTALCPSYDSIPFPRTVTIPSVHFLFRRTLVLCFHLYRHSSLITPSCSFPSHLE